MKTLVACLVCVAIGAFVGYQINENRYGKFPTTFGPFVEDDSVTVAQARENVRAFAVSSKAMVDLPDGRVHDFGVMAPEEEGEHIFVIRNVGEDDLSLKLGASTCKCTLGELGSNTLPPGGQTEVKMSWKVNTNGSDFGQSAEVITNDPSNVAVKFEITGKVVRDMEAVPPSISFGEIAAGDPIRMETRIFSYMDGTVEPIAAKFSSDELNELSSFEIEPFEPSSDHGIHEVAREGFLIKATVQPGMRQGPINQNLVFEFRLRDRENAAAVNGKDSDTLTAAVPVTGRIVGVLSMLETTQLKGVAGGGYMYEFDEIKDADDLEMTAYVRLKGDEDDSTQLVLGDFGPEGVLEATLGDPLGSGKTRVYPVKVKLIPGEKTVERLGLNREDYGFINIESDNPKVPPLKLRLKFSLPAR